MPFEVNYKTKPWVYNKKNYSNWLISIVRSLENNVKWILEMLEGEELNFRSTQVMNMETNAKNDGSNVLVLGNPSCFQLSP